MSSERVVWEYDVRTFEHSLADALLKVNLDDHGDEEWELVAFDFVAGRAIFKRPRDLHAETE